VPFRLIYAYNPNARSGTVQELPGVFFDEKKSVFRSQRRRTFLTLLNVNHTGAVFTSDEEGKVNSEQ